MSSFSKAQESFEAFEKGKLQPSDAVKVLAFIKQCKEVAGRFTDDKMIKILSQDAYNKTYE